MRHHLVRRRLAPHLPTGGHVLDVGCGPGWLAIDLVRRGFRVTAVDVDPVMVGLVDRRRRGLPPSVAARLELVEGRAEDVAHLVADPVDVLCAHAVLPFVTDAAAVLGDAVGLVRSGGLVSIVAKNAAALPLRAGRQGRFADALDLADGAEEHDETGRVLRAHRREDVVATLARVGVSTASWHGMQVVTGHRHDRPEPRDLALAVELEQRLGDHDPARLVARQFHVIGTRDAGGTA